MVEDTKTLAKSQKHRQSHKNVSREIKTLAKSQYFWRKAKNIDEDALTLAKRQKHRRRRKAVGGETKPIGEALPTMVENNSYLIE
jgi:hypothetical protein